MLDVDMSEKQIMFIDENQIKTWYLIINLISLQIENKEK